MKFVPKNSTLRRFRPRRPTGSSRCVNHQLRLQKPKLGESLTTQGNPGSKARGGRREQNSLRDEPRPASWAEIVRVLAGTGIRVAGNVTANLRGQSSLLIPLKSPPFLRISGIASKTIYPRRLAQSVQVRKRVKTSVFKLDHRTRGGMLLMCGVDNGQLAKRDECGSRIKNKRNSFRR